MTTHFGDRALRIPRAGGPAAGELAAARALPGVIDACVTEEWLVVYFADDVEPPAHLDLLARDEAALPGSRELRVRYDGEDLADVARMVGRTVEEVCALHQEATYTVAFLGFMPGFAYLVGLPRALEVPRRDTPRPRVPAGALGIAGPYTGVYPFESPGGWRLLGTLVGPSLFGPEGALLRPGDRVRIVAA